jgi:enediyne biosynthesis protein E4
MNMGTDSSLKLVHQWMSTPIFINMARPVFLWFCLLAAACSKPNNTLFEKIMPSTSNIYFNNSVTENDSINPLDMEFLYNGGGVAVGDFNRDGRPDLYFTASQVSNKMYLNERDFRFKDVTKQAKVSGDNRWCNGSSVVDINHDGWDDIYVCASVWKNPEQRRNLFYINQGVDKDGVPHFTEEARAYNLADTGFSVHAAFFDYDRDGDLDVYLVTTSLATRNSTRFDGSGATQQHALTDKLFRNDGSDSLGHPYFVDVSLQAGIQDDGYGLGVAVADVNGDGWKDIYVTNDFYTSDKLYINNHNGTFSDRAKDCFKHTSQNAMGNDIADINNDGLPDIIAVDMNPQDNYRKKTNMNGINLFIPDQMMNTGHVLQYVRNTLQVNNGLIPTDSNSLQIPIFSDISFYAGVAETDWSWNPSLADFDNDGLRDLIITNGYPKDVTDHDFATYRQNATNIASKKEVLAQIPQIKIANYAFHNKGDLHFQDVSASWGLNDASFSYGAAYVDLDNDGDLDYVVNNINDRAFIYRNNNTAHHHFLNLKFRSTSNNRNGLGAVAEIYYGQNKQVSENAPYRGYISTVEASVHFGLGSTQTIDSIIVKWPSGERQVIRAVKADQTLIVEEPNDRSTNSAILIDARAQTPRLFTNVTDQTGLEYRHVEMPYSDFDDQRLLPHKLSQYGPSLAVGDVDGNGYDDLFIGASAGFNGQLFLQQSNGKFESRKLVVPAGADSRKPEMMGALLFDADGDSDLDLFVAAGSTEFAANTKNYSDQFFINDGRGNLSLLRSAIPNNLSSKSCVKAADFDKDGDLDLFIGGRVLPHRYPQPVSSFIYRNDSKNGSVQFTDVTKQVAPLLEEIGLMCDALWTDFDNDSWPDLVVSMEWAPVTFIRNDHGVFKKITAGVEDKIGWWNSLAAADFDNDGDIDYVAGNVGLNSFFRSSPTQPVCVYASDFNNDGFYDAIPTVFLPGKNGQKREYPANGRDDFLKVLVGKRKKFDRYTTFATADINDLLTSDERKHSLFLKANYFASALFQNRGNGTFDVKMLPAVAQFAPVYGMLPEDVNGDGNLDLALCGNDFGNEVVNGRYDAMNGAVLLGNGDGTFNDKPLDQTGFFVPGDAKALVKLVIRNKAALAASQNGGRLLLFNESTPGEDIRLKDDDLYAVVELQDGRKRKEEAYFGTSFLSQSTRTIKMNRSVRSIEITNRAGSKAVIRPRLTMDQK